MTQPSRVRYDQPEPPLWPWVLLVFASLVALGSIVLFASFPVAPPVPAPEPDRQPQVTVYRTPHVDTAQLRTVLRQA